MSNTPTAEQTAAIDAFRTGTNLVLEAGAGSGKTSTLQMMGAATPNRSGLYLAFNKAIATEASSKFVGTGVKPMTAHALAYQSHGKPFQSKLNRGNRMPSRDKTALLGISGAIRVGGTLRSNSKNVSAYLQTRAVFDTLNQFCLRDTDEAVITPDMVPIPAALSLDEEEKAEFRAVIAPIAQRAWTDIISPDGKLPFDHAYYVKLWSMSRPVINTDIIFADEAQDLDPVILGVLKRQQAQIVAVGDRHQAIYGWRGAVDALDAFGGERYRLTQSFRFGQAIADEANIWLSHMGSDFRITGDPTKQSSVWESKVNQPSAVLTRSNAQAIIEIMRCQDQQITTAIAGKNKAQQIRGLATAAEELQTKHFTAHPEFAGFRSWDDLCDYAQEDEGADLATFVNLVNQHGTQAILGALDKCVPEDHAETVISTAHVAKGLEWKHVRIAPDFYEPGKDDDGKQKPLRRDEAMLIYVAVTRAKRHLSNGGVEWGHTFTGGCI